MKTAELEIQLSKSFLGRNAVNLVLVNQVLNRLSSLDFLGVTSLRNIAVIFALAVSIVSLDAFASKPEELRLGEIKFEIERDNYLDALTLMTEEDKVANPANYGAALLYYLEDPEEAQEYLDNQAESLKKQGIDV